MQSMVRRLSVCLLIGTVLAAVPSFGALGDRYAVVLQDAPAAKVARGSRPGTSAFESARDAIRQKQDSLKTALASQGFKVTGSVEIFLNAVFVVADRADLPKVRALPGVRYVAFMPAVHKKLNTASQLVDANPTAWNAFGGITNSGTGIKIAIIDTGIDQTHPAFQGSNLPMPAGYPKCDVPANCAFTNNKVIVARSYVSQLNTAVASTSTPDITTPQDFDGHGTSVAMVAAGGSAVGPLATINGLAPAAYVGNYKVYGSPGINDYSTGQAFMNALEDAFTDGMNVVNYSSGSTPFTGPEDSGAACGNPTGELCDPTVTAVENAIQTGNMVVVAAGGNEGGNGYRFSVNHGPATYNTISSPAYAPDVIATAATGNLHAFPFGVALSGTNLPSNLQFLNASEDGDGVQAISVLQAPLIDAGTVGDLYGCSAYPVSSMFGKIALIERGAASGASCTFETKAINAGNAGAVAALFFDSVAESPFPPGIASSAIPAFLIGQTDGQNLKTYIDANVGVTANLGASGPPSDAADTNQVTSFSSRGPVLGSYALKPDIAAPGENIYTAAENSEPDGELYDPTRFTAAAGTSYSTPIISGIAALVRQSHPSWSATQVKSAIVNTATSDTSDLFVANSLGNPAAGVLSVGGGKAEAAHAIQTNVTVEPSTISFGALSSGFPSNSISLVVTNKSNGSLTLSLAISRSVSDSKTQLTVDTPTVTLAAGTSQTVHVTLSGSLPLAGIYEGALQITGGSQPLHVPYLYMVGDGVPFDFVILAGDGETGTVGQVVPDGFTGVQVFDQYGIAIQGVPIAWGTDSTNAAGSVIQQAQTSTDAYGIATAIPVLGTTPGTYTYNVTISGIGAFGLTDAAAAAPAINSGGVVNAASYQLAQGIAPGSYVTIFGSNLSPSTLTQNNYASRVPLPIQIGGASVSFDATGVSVPGYLNYAGSGQINAVVPWELAGASSVQMKVNISYGIVNPGDAGSSTGSLITVPVTTYSPAIFPYPDPNGTSVAAAVDATGKVVTSANPATRGQYISLYCNGLGPVSNAPADGAAALASPLSSTPSLPVVTIGGQSATVQFSGLAPGFVGLYQVNVQVPAGINAGSQPVQLSIGNVAAPTINISVQ